jgi:hypothetical protein
VNGGTQQRRTRNRAAHKGDSIMNVEFKKMTDEGHAKDFGRTKETHRKTQKDTERQRKTKKDEERQRKTQKDTEGHRKTKREKRRTRAKDLKTAVEWTGKIQVWLTASCRVFADLASARQAHVYLVGII